VILAAILRVAQVAVGEDTTRTNKQPFSTRWPSKF